MVEARGLKKIRVFAFSHRLFPPEFPTDDGRYFKVQCGAANGRLPGFSAYDDDPGSRSDLNWCFCEVTGIKRVIQDRDLWSGADYLGFAHYRRYLDFSGSSLSDNAVLCSRFPIGTTVIRQYAACHPLGAYWAFLDELKRSDASLVSRIEKYFQESREFYRANCFVAPLRAFEAYREFVSKIWPAMVEVAESEKVCTASYGAYQKRYMGFLFERLTSFWLASECGAGKVNVPLIDLDVSNGENGTR